MSGKSAPLPEWEAVLSAAAHLQEILPDAVLAGDTAAAIPAQHRLSPERHWHGCLADSVAAIHAPHRLSQDAVHVLTDQRQRFDQILVQLESVAGWRTARVAQPVLILGSSAGHENACGKFSASGSGPCCSVNCATVRHNAIIGDRNRRNDP